MITAIPDSIVMYDTERDYHHRDLDLVYIDRVADAAARSLAHRVMSVEIAYQPGDGTFYGLVFVPLNGVITVPARIVDGVLWERHAVRGMQMGRDDSYSRDAFLVCWAEHTNYPLHLGGRAGVLAASYVAEHWKAPSVSAVSLAVLFRAIAHHLDKHDERDPS